MMALKPWGGNHANLLHCLRLQRTYQFTGGNYSWLCEALLPVPGREMRAHLGIRTYIQAFLETPSPTPRHTPSRENQKFAGGSAARTVPAGQLLATRLIRVPCSQPPRRDPAPRSRGHNAHLSTPTPECLQRRHISRLRDLIWYRRFWRGGTRVAAGGLTISPQKSQPRRPIVPATAALKFSVAPRRARLPLLTPAGSTALGAGYPAPGAGHCPAAGRARSPRSS